MAPLNGGDHDLLVRRRGAVSVAPPAGIDTLYSLRITQARRCTAYRNGDFIRFLTIAPDYDSTSGRKESPQRTQVDSDFWLRLLTPKAS